MNRSASSSCPWTTDLPRARVRPFHRGRRLDHRAAERDRRPLRRHAAAAAPLRLYPRTHARAVRARTVAIRCAGLARLPALAKSCRRTIRPRYRDAATAHNAFTLFELDAARRTRACAAPQGVGRHAERRADGAAAARAGCAGARRDIREAQPHELAVASIMNLREAHGEDTARTFGQFLSSFRVSHPVPAKASRSADCRARRASPPPRASSAKSFIWSTLSRWPSTASSDGSERAQERMRRLREELSGRRRRLVAQRQRVCGARRERVAAPLYIRGVPTGPLSPIVVAVTTAGDTLCAGVPIDDRPHSPATTSTNFGLALAAPAGSPAMTRLPSRGPARGRRPRRGAARAGLRRRRRPTPAALETPLRGRRVARLALDRATEDRILALSTRSTSARRRCTMCWRRRRPRA